MARETWTQQERDRLTELFSQGNGTRKIARIMGKTPGQISGKARIMRLQFAHGNPTILPKDHPAMIESRTLHKGMVRPVGTDNVLKPGDNQRKLGSRVTKGAWKGMPIYSLTLEERATCPRSCLQFGSCYANHMGLAVRYKAGPELEAKIGEELAHLQCRHPDGFVVRLHIAGDFYSRDYVLAWELMLDAFPALHVFGYTARKHNSVIGAAVAQLRERRWDRFAIRTSGAASGPRTLVAKKPKAGAITCPAQTGGTKCCASCGLCWSPAAREKPILFLAH